MSYALIPYCKTHIFKNTHNYKYLYIKYRLIINNVYIMYSTIVVKYINYIPTLESNNIDVYIIVNPIKLYL